jgi:hypothetical protein
MKLNQISAGQTLSGASTSEASLMSLMQTRFGKGSLLINGRQQLTH